jgi:hypothetical protein
LLIFSYLSEYDWSIISYIANYPGVHVGPAGMDDTKVDRMRGEAIIVSIVR